MADDIFEGSHAEFVANESFVSDGEKRWLAWVKAVEKLLGHSLDGNQQDDCYSLDFAYDDFEAGLTPDQYVAGVRKAKEEAGK